MITRFSIAAFISLVLSVQALAAETENPSIPTQVQLQLVDDLSGLLSEHYVLGPPPTSYSRPVIVLLGFVWCWVLVHFSYYYRSAA